MKTIFKKSLSILMIICLMLLAFSLGSRNVLAAEYSEVTTIEDGKYFIVTTSSTGTKYYLPTANTADAGPAKYTFTDYVEIDDENLWNVSIVSDNLIITNDSGAYLYTTASNGGVRVGSTSDDIKTWTYSSGSLQYNKTTRYLGVRTDGSEWRSYTSSNDENYTGTGRNVKFIKKTEGGSKLSSFTSLQTKASLKVGYTESASLSGVLYQHVTDISQLQDGDKVIIAASKGGETFVATDISSSVMGKVECASSSGIIHDISTGILLTLVIDGENYSFKNESDELLGCTAVKKLAWGSGTTTWTISIEEGKATIASTTSSYGKLLYNSSSPRFTTYTSSQTSPQIYKQTTGIDYEIISNEDVNEVSLRFGGLIDSTIYDELDLLKENTISYGLLYAKESYLLEENVTISEVVEVGMLELFDGIKVTECSPVVQDDHYQFAVVINGIPTESFDEKIVAVCYVLIDDVYFLMNETSYSVNSIAEKYVSDNLGSYQEHIGMLSWLKSYTGGK